MSILQLARAPKHHLCNSRSLKTISAVGVLRGAMLSSVSMVIIYGIGHASAEDRVNPAGTTVSDTIVLNAGDSLTNAGIIEVPNGVGAGFPGPNSETIAFILNSGTVRSGNDLAIGVNGNLIRFENSGTISGSDGAFGVARNVGSFTNSGTIVSAGNTAVFGGSFDTFKNSGTISGQRFNAVYADTGVGSFLNESTGVIINTNRLDGDGDAISFNTDLADGGAVGSFVNNGLIQGDLSGTDSVGVRFFDEQNDPSAFVTDSFVNTGTIEGSERGVQSRGGFNSFSNSGLIAGGENGMGTDGNIGTFTNSGTIRGTTDSGIYIVGRAASLVNSGTIEGNRGSAMYLEGGVDSFVNETNGIIRNIGTVAGFGNGVDFNTDLQNGGAVTSFINRGIISAAPTSVEGVGVGFFDNSNTGPNAFETMSFLNAGTITGVGNGVFSRGGFGDFINSGTIDGGIYSGVSTDGNIGTFVNSGTISSIDGSGVGVDGATGTFTNTGSILAPNDGGVYLDGPVGTFVNDGTIRSERNGVSFFGGVTSGMNTGTIVSTAASGEIGVRIDEPGGTFTNSGTVEGAAGVVYSLNNSGTNLLVNSGTISGTGGTAISFDGNQAGDDTLRLETGSRVLGNVQFGSGSDTIDFSNFSGNALLDVYDVENIVSGDRAYFQLPNDQLGIIEKTGVVSPTSQAVIDTVLAINHALPRQGSNALGGLAPQDSPVSGYAPVPTLTPASAAIADAQKTSEFNIWGTLIAGGSHDQSPVDIDSRFGGLVAGSHAQLVPGLTLGVVGAYVGSSFDSNGAGQTVDSQAGIVGVYGYTKASVAEINFALLGGFADNHSERQTVALGAAETAVADYGSWFISPSIGIAVPVMTSDDGELRIVSDVTYVGGETSNYSETGSAMNLTVGSASIGLLDAKLGLEGVLYKSSEALGAAAFSAGAGVFVQSNLVGSTAPVTLLGQTQQVSLPGMTAVGIYGGAGLEIVISTGVDLKLDIEGRWRDDGLLSGSARLGLNAEF